MFFNIEDGEINTITLSLGRKYLLAIGNAYIYDVIDIEEFNEEINSFINSINNKKNINNFKLPLDLYRFFINKKKIKDLAYRLRGEEDDFSYIHLFYHFMHMYKSICKDRKNGQIHLWVNLEAKEPKEYKNLGDGATDHNSIMCKFKLKQFKQYTDRSKTCEEGWTYALCTFYLIVISKLYRLLKRHIVKRPIENNIDKLERFLAICFRTINIVITGFRFTTTYNLGDIQAHNLISEFMQLTPCGDYIKIPKFPTKQTLQFTYCNYNKAFKPLLEDNSITRYRGDKNGKRLVSMYVKGEENLLTLKIDIVGLQAIEDITELAANKTLYDFVTDYDSMVYYILSTMLSHTHEYKSIVGKCQNIAVQAWNSKKLRTIFNYKSDNCSEKTDIIKAHIKQLLINNAFKDVCTKNIINIARALGKTHPMQEMVADYIIIAIELSEKSDIEISKILNDFITGAKQQAKIRKMVAFVREFNEIFPKVNLLNLLHREVNYR